MVKTEERSFKSIFPMIREYCAICLEENDPSVSFITRGMAMSDRNVLPKFLTGKVFYSDN